MLQRVERASYFARPQGGFLRRANVGTGSHRRREVRDLIEQLKHEGKTVFFSTHILSDAVPAMRGHHQQRRMQGVGGWPTLRRASIAKWNWCGKDSGAGLAEDTGAECYVVGTRSARSPEANQTPSSSLRRERLRLISVTPVRTSLEDYFMQKLQPTSATSVARSEARV